MTDFIYSYQKKIFDLKFISSYVYHIKPKTIEKKHFHKGVEFLYVLDGFCKTHKKGKLYFYGINKVHEVVNDSQKDVSLLCIQIPAESNKNTFTV